MGFNLMKMLGLEKKSAPDYSAVTNAVRPFQSLTEIPVGATLNDIILKALKEQKGIGFGPEYTDKTTSPLVATRQARWKEEELPNLESSLSSRGLSRSTLGARDIGKAEASKERDINDIIAQAYKEQEAQKKVDQAKYEGLGQWYTGAEAATKGAYAAEDVRRMGIASDAENKYRADKEIERVQDQSKTYALVADAIMGAVSGGMAGGGSLNSIIMGALQGGAGSFGKAMASDTVDYKQLADFAKQYAGSQAKAFI